MDSATVVFVLFKWNTLGDDESIQWIQDFVICLLLGEAQRACMEQLPGPEQPRPFQAAFLTKQESRNCVLADIWGALLNISIPQALSFQLNVLPWHILCRQII